MPSKPEELPFLLRSIEKDNQTAYSTGKNFWVDIDGDGVSELLRSFSEPVGDGNFKSAVLVFKGSLGKEYRFQFNGHYPECRIWSINAIDVDGNPGKEIVLTKHKLDTALLEIMSVDSNCELLEPRYIVAAIGNQSVKHGEWSNLSVEPIAAIDVNGDGQKDLIYSRSAKPDSAFDRGIVAYDLANRHQLWFFPTADYADPNHSFCFKAHDRQRYCAFVIESSGNHYASNGMDSNHAYILVLDLSGREIWRRTIGGIDSHPAMCIDTDDNGLAQGIYATRSSDDDSPSLPNQIARFDPLTGVQSAVSPIVPGSLSPQIRMLDTQPDSAKTILVNITRDSANDCYVLDKDLEMRRHLTGSIYWIGGQYDLLGDGRREVIALTNDERLVILDDRLKPLAWQSSSGEVSISAGMSPPEILCNRGLHDYEIFTLEKQSLFSVVYARYWWWMAVVAAAILMLVLSKVGHGIRSLYISAAGVPGLDRVDSMVMVLGQNGKIQYVNKHPLANRLLGSGHSSRIPLKNTRLREFPSIIEAIERPLEKPGAPVTEEMELTDRGVRLRLAVTVYPRLDRDRKFVGKIAIVEDITSRAAWQRKVVLGEAAQRWVHKLKGNLATTRIHLENLREDERLRGILPHEVLSEYLKTIDVQLEATSQTATKILRFSSIGKPDKVRCDLNAIIEAALRPPAVKPSQGLVVVRKLQPDLPYLMIDPVQLSEVFDNLVSNAVRAMKNNGELTVGSRLASHLQMSEAKECIEVTVADTGTGISPEDRPRIFSPGFSKHGSTGVGLALVKEIVENHKGTIEVESTPGKGSIFRILLPVNGSPNEH